MSFLLDTHAFLWFLAGDPRLSERALEVIENQSHAKYVSATSCWEIAIKHSRGRLELGHPLEVLFHEGIEGNGFVFLNIDRKHVLSLPPFREDRRDPFDRLLAAQCSAEGLVLVSGDEMLDNYAIERIW